MAGTCNAICSSASTAESTWSGWILIEKEANTMGLDIYAGTLTRYYSHKMCIRDREDNELNGDYDFYRPIIRLENYD